MFKTAKVILKEYDFEKRSRTCLDLNKKVKTKIDINFIKSFLQTDTGEFGFSVIDGAVDHWDGEYFLPCVVSHPCCFKYHFKIKIDSCGIPLNIHGDYLKVLKAFKDFFDK